MDSVGVITGTVLTSATVGTHSFTVSALSLGYFTQTYAYPLVIKDAAASKYVTIKLSVNFSAGSSKLSIVQKAKILLFVNKVKPKIVDGIVIGYVQRTKKTSNDKTLSAARAQVIAKFLAANGVKVPLLTQGSGVLNGSNAARMSTISLRYYKV
jgi:outer membrane protein OmpA-like peptidoglycan-associated protein